MHFQPVWFDSFGAKSSCVKIETPDVSIVIDPGAAIMQPSFPASLVQKLLWLEQGKRAVKNACKNTDIIVISHYHYDHYFPEDIDIYRNKLLLAKNPNEYINDSQRARAEAFYSKLFHEFGGIGLEEVVKKPKSRSFPHPLEGLPLVKERYFFGDKRKREILSSGLKWYDARCRNWCRVERIPEMEFESVRIRFPEGKTFRFGKTILRFTKPMFHGIEFSRVGWVFASVIEFGDEKLIHTSDLCGPVIEDYAEWIIKENPNVLVLDGPMTYMLGYLLSKENLQRSVNNLIKILKETETRTIIYDHHLLREKRFKENTINAWKTAKELGKNLLTAAEYVGKKPKVLEV